MSIKAQRLKLESIWTPAIVVINIFLCVLTWNRFRDALLFAPINPDTGTYLSSIERVFDGTIPYKDFRLAYAPLGLTILGVFRVLFSDITNSYLVYYGTVVFFCLLVALEIYAISTFVSKSRSMRICLSISSALSIYCFDGSYPCLEIFVAFFSLAGVISCLFGNWSTISLILSGMLFACSFLSKQYGVLGMLAITTYITLIRTNDTKTKIYELSLFYLGASIVILLSLAAFAVLGVSPGLLFSNLWLPTYISNDTDLSHYKVFLFSVFPVLLFTPFVLIQADRTKIRTIILFLLLIACNSCAILVRAFPHYFILLIPYTTLLILSILELAQVTVVKFSLVGFYLYFLLSYVHAHQYFEDTNVREDQYELSRKVSSIVPPKTRALVFADPWLIYTAHIYPVDDHKLSYGFVSNFSGKEIMEFISNSNTIVVDRDSEVYFRQILQRLSLTYEDFTALLNKLGFSLTSEIPPSHKIWSR